MLTRRETLRGGSAAVAAIAVTGAVAAAVPAIAKSATSQNLPAAVDGPLIALADEMRRVWRAYADADTSLDEDRHGDRKGVLSVAARKALTKTKEQNLGRFHALEQQLIETPARSVQGVLAKLRGTYLECEVTEMRSGGGDVDDLPSDYASSIYRDLERLAGEA